MKKRLLAALFALAICAALLCTGALAEDEGLTPENPIEISGEGLATNGTTLYGINATWFEKYGEGTYYVEFVIPNNITAIAKDCFRYGAWSGDKEDYGALNYHNNPGYTINVVGIDFSEATDLTIIGSQAASGCSQLTGVLDLSNTKIETLEKSAFNGCTGLTGVILPDTLKNLGDAGSGSVFNGCNNLEFIRTAGGDPNAVFELPDGLEVIGRQTFKSCFASDVVANVVIPASVETIGSEAFYTGRISQIVVERQGDGWASNYDGYDSGAFKTGNSSMLVIFNDYDSYQDYSLNVRPNSTIKRAMAHPMTLTFGSTGTTQSKLNYQSIQYEPVAGTPFWTKNTAYTLPSLDNTPDEKPGYDTGWTLGGSPLSNTSTLSAVSDEATARVSYSLQNPTIQFSVDGVAQGDNNDLTVDLNDGKPHSAGVLVDHPLLLGNYGSEEGEYVYFEYAWWDESGENSGVNGPRSEEEPELFSKESGGTPQRVKTDKSEVPIERRAHERVDGQYYMVEIYGYIVRDGAPEFFYKSHYNFIDFVTDNDHQATVDDSYFFEVEVLGSEKYAITVSQEGEGTVTAPDKAAPEETVTIAVEPGSGYELGGVAVTAGGAELELTEGEDGRYSFTMPESAVEINVTFEKKPPVIPDRPEQPEEDDDTGVGEWLDLLDHRAYLNGYPDGTFGPEKPMTRAEAAQMFYNLLLDRDVENSAAFTDVAPGAWYEKAVNALASLGIITGYEDGTFRPENTITRAEFVTMAMRFANEPENYVNSFSDVSASAWYYEAVAGAAHYGWLNGYPDGTFRPNASITRAEVATAMNRVLERECDKNYVNKHADELLSFADLAPAHWAYYDVAEASNGHGYVRTPEENWTGLD